MRHSLSFTRLFTLGGICFPCTLLSKLPSVNLQNAPFVTIALLLIKEFTAKGVQSWAHHAHGIHWLYHDPCHREVGSSKELWNGFWKLKGWQYLEELGQGSPEGLSTLTQHLLYGAISLTTRIQRSRIQGVEVGGGTQL